MNFQGMRRSWSLNNSGSQSNMSFRCCSWGQWYSPDAWHRPQRVGCSWEPGACVVVLAGQGSHASLSLASLFPGEELAGPSGYVYLEPVDYTCFQAYLPGLFPGLVLQWVNHAGGVPFVGLWVIRAAVFIQDENRYGVLGGVDISQMCNSRCQYTCVWDPSMCRQEPRGGRAGVRVQDRGRHWAPSFSIPNLKRPRILNLYLAFQIIMEAYLSEW